MNSYLYLAVIITLELLNYLLVYIVVFHAKLKENKCWLLCLLVVYAVVFWIKLNKINDDFPEIYLLFLGVIMPLTCFKGRITKWVSIYPAVPILVSIFSTFIIYSFAIYDGGTFEKIYENEICVLIGEAVPSVIMLVILLYYIKTKKTWEEITLKGKQYFLLWMCSIFSVCVMGISQIISSRDNYTLEKLNLYGIAMTGICGLCLFYAIWNGIILQNKQEQEYKFEQLKIFMRLQERQFDSIIRSDEKLRAYKHDMKAHLLTLQAMCSEKEQPELAEYIHRNITESEIFHTFSYTGNVAVDAVLQNLREEAEKLGITVNYKCHMTESSRIELYDLCTVLSNLLNNAIEASRNAMKEKEISLKLNSVHEQLYILASNTTNSPAIIRDGMLMTSKTEKHHGLGSHNVRLVVEQYGGSIEYRNEDGWFLVEILL